MKFAQNNHPTLLFGPSTCLFGTWEYLLGFLLQLRKIFLGLDISSSLINQSFMDIEIYIRKKSYQTATDERYVANHLHLHFQDLLRCKQHYDLLDYSSQRSQEMSLVSPYPFQISMTLFPTFTKLTWKFYSRV